MRQFEYNGYKDNNRVECNYLEVSRVAHWRTGGKWAALLHIIMLIYLVSHYY